MTPKRPLEVFGEHLEGLCNIFWAFFGKSGAFYWLTGDAGSSNSAITSRNCSTVRMPAWPKRGMPEQALKALAFHSLLQV